MKSCLAVKAVSFDAANTLIYVSPSVGHHYADVAHRFGTYVKSEVLDIKFWEVYNARGGLSSLGAFASEPEERAWWKETARGMFECGSEPQPFDDFFDALYARFATPEAWSLFPEVVSTLSDLHEKGFRLAVLSNFDRRLHSLIRAFGLDRYISETVISSEAGAAKPHSRIFSVLAEKLSLKPEEILHVGEDRICDGEGALAAGFKAVLLNRADEHPNWKGPVISSLGELVSLLTKGLN